MGFVELEGVDNVRDLGGIPVRGGRAIADGLFYRGGALNNATEPDRAMLFGTLGIACVVDVRCGWECDAYPNAIPRDVEYLHIPFYDLEKVGIEYTERVEGTKAQGRDIACDPEHFYRSLANRLTTAQMGKALGALLERASAGHAVYMHCSGGKDRAGIMALLVLTALGANREDILADYLLTNESRDKRYDQMLERFRRFTDDEQHARELVESHRARPDNLRAFYEAIDEEYGGMGAFMRDQMHLSDDRIEEARRACTCARPANLLR